MSKRIVIVGAGHSGGRVAENLRCEGWQGEILLIGDEAHLPYERPPLSKELLRGEMEPAKALLHTSAFYAKNDISMIGCCAVTAIDRRARIAHCGSRAFSYDSLILATGARARASAIPGADLEGVFTLRTIDDAVRLASHLLPGIQVIAIGGGFIGLEVAMSVLARGGLATVVETSAQILGRSVAPEIGRLVAAAHRRSGLSIRLNSKVRAIEGDRRVTGVLLDDNERLAADLVVLGIGARINDELAVAAGLACDDGILVDSSLCTTDPAIYAIGDAARVKVGATEGRLESWENAELQAARLARILVGKPVLENPIPWFWSDQGSLNLQILGTRLYGEPIFRGDPQSQVWSAFHVKGERIVAAYLVNSGREKRPVRTIMERQVAVTRAQLEDTNTPLRYLAG